MLEENVAVIVRCRPLIGKEKEEEVILKIDEPERKSCRLLGSNHEKIFNFYKVYGHEDTTGKLYAEVGAPIIEGTLNGYNGTIFAYGQTGSGKSYTIVGPDLYSPLRGILPRAVDHIFEHVSSAQNVHYLIHASFLEIYNEEIRDLLNRNLQNLELREHPEDGMFVEGLSLYPLNSRKQCFKLIKAGLKQRVSGYNPINKESSRSHIIFTIRIECTDFSNSSSNENAHIKVGKLNIVDLAGSEKPEKSVNNLRFKESTKINLSLTALSNVISALVDESNIFERFDYESRSFTGKHTHIPYRESKLTRLLQDSLGGTAKTLMIACVAPSLSNYNETLSTLRYANRAKKIQNTPIVNEDPKDALLRKYQLEIDHLKKIASGFVPQLASSGSLRDFKELEKSRQYYENQLANLKMKLEQEYQSKQKLLEEIKRYKTMNSLDSGKQEKSSDYYSSPKKGPSIQSPSRSARCIQLADYKSESSDKDTSSDGSNDFNMDFNFPGNLDKIFDIRTRANERLKYLQAQMLGGKGAYEGEWKSMGDKIKSLENRLADLQSESEEEKSDYVDTIKKQDKFIVLLTQIINKFEINDIIDQAKWDDKSETWQLPDLNVREGEKEAISDKNTSNFTSQAGENFDTQNFIFEDNLEIKRTTTISPKREVPNKQPTTSSSNDQNYNEDSPKRKPSITFK